MSSFFTCGVRAYVRPYTWRVWVSVACLSVMFVIVWCACVRACVNACVCTRAGVCKECMRAFLSIWCAKRRTWILSNNCLVEIFNFQFWRQSFGPATCIFHTCNSSIMHWFWQSKGYAVKEKNTRAGNKYNCILRMRWSCKITLNLPLTQHLPALAYMYYLYR